MLPLLRQRDTALLLQRHEKAIDELFAVYTPPHEKAWRQPDVLQATPPPPPPHAHTHTEPRRSRARARTQDAPICAPIYAPYAPNAPNASNIRPIYAQYAPKMPPRLQMCRDFGLIGKKIVTVDEVEAVLKRMQSVSSYNAAAVDAYALHPIERKRVDELLYRLALAATEKNPTLVREEPHKRLHALLESLLMTNPDALKRMLGGLHLLKVSADGKLDKIQEFLKGGAAVDMKDGNGATALHRASMYGHTRAAAVLIAAGAPLVEKTADGWTPLHCASEYGHVGVVLELLQKGAPTEAATTRGGWTPLHRAALDGHEDVVAELLRAHAPLEPRDSVGDTPLHDACRNGHLQVVQRLLRAGALVDVANFEGRTPLNLAKEFGRTKVIEELEPILARQAPPPVVTATPTPALVGATA
mmetsp:Transcript_3187/g.9583  ORF Transcript_3187/g.9583 Transcript_3187/m.9583 type:complete len:415 (-) Transcript_3187:373-1617(-)